MSRPEIKESAGSLNLKAFKIELFFFPLSNVQIVLMYIVEISLYIKYIQHL